MRAQLLHGLVLALAVTGCGTSKFDTSKPIDPGGQRVIAEQRLENNYKRQGVRVIYTLLGGLEAIEATGYAPVWGGSENAAREAYRAAELEAKKVMNEFINKESVQSSTSIMMVSRNLEKATDNRTNDIASNNKMGDRVAASITDDDAGDEKQSAVGTNKAVRADALNIVSRLNTSIKTNSSGILTGLYLVEGEVINQGKTVRVVYRWDRRHAKDIDEVRKLMSR